MRTFEDWMVYVLGGIGAVGMMVTGRVMKVQDEQAKKIAEHDEIISALVEAKDNTKASLERIESKVDRIIEREIGA